MRPADARCTRLRRPTSARSSWASASATAALALLATSTAALAGPSGLWSLGVVPADRSHEYVEEDSIARASDGVWNAQVISVMPARGRPNGYATLIWDTRIDCSRHAFAYVTGRSFDASGSVVQSVVARPGGWAPTATDTGTAQIETFVCNDAVYRNRHFDRARPGEVALPPIGAFGPNALPVAARPPRD